MAGSLCMQSTQKVCWHGSSLGSVYWSRQTPHVNWSSNCCLNDRDSAILNDRMRYIDELEFEDIASAPQNCIAIVVASYDMAIIHSTYSCPA